MKNLQVPLGCISHALDPFGFGVWQVQCYVPLHSYFTILLVSNTLNLPFGFYGHFSHFQDSMFFSLLSMFLYFLVSVLIRVYIYIYIWGDKDWSN